MKVVISGSFRKHLDGILDLKNQLINDGIDVLKPVDSSKIDNKDNPEFIKFEGEEKKSEYELEQEYLIAIEEADVHIIYNQDNYIGESALFEICYGAGNNSLSKKIKNVLPDTKINPVIYLAFPLKEYKGEYSDNPYKMVETFINMGYVRVGIDTMYNDFNINKKKK